MDYIEVPNIELNKKEKEEEDEKEGI